MGKSAPPPQPPVDGKIKFSFEHYDIQRPEYCLSGWGQDKVKRTLACLKNINGKSFNELRSQRTVYHFNEVDWAKTNEKKGFQNPLIVNLAAFHFALIGVNKQLARVYGVYSQNIFYIVWFDLNHVIWPVALKNT